MAPAKNSHFRRITDFQFDPWGTKEERRAWRNERNRRWISQISDRDWERIDALIDQVTPHYNPAALDDLDAPIRIGVAPEQDALRYSGEVFGRMRGCVLMGWPKR